MSVVIVYETHATTLDNERGFATGWLPGELSKAGRDHARELGRRRRSEDLAAVYVSDLTRAVHTAEIAFDGTTVPIALDERLRECNYGELDGAPVDVLALERPRRIAVPFPGGESYQDVVERTRDLLDDLVVAHGGARVCLIAHTANRWSLDHLVPGKPLEEGVSAPFDWRPGWQYVVS